MTKADIKAYFSKLGRKGGRRVTAAKIAACRANAKLPRKKAA